MHQAYIQKQADGSSWEWEICYINGSATSYAKQAAPYHVSP